MYISLRKDLQGPETIYDRINYVYTTLTTLLEYDLIN